MPNTLHDLDWIAFLYVSDELDASQRASFEDRLDQDQAAREAVASAVGLLETLTHAGVADPLRIPMYRTRTSRRRWIGLAAAAAIAGALVLLPSRKAEPPTSETTSPPAQNEPITADVVLAWSDLHERRVAEPTELWSQGEPVEVIDPTVAPDESPPSWLLMAAAPESDADPLEAEPRQED